MERSRGIVSIVVVSEWRVADVYRNPSPVTCNAGIMLLSCAPLDLMLNEGQMWVPASAHWIVQSVNAYMGQER